MNLLDRTLEKGFKYSKVLENENIKNEFLSIIGNAELLRLEYDNGEAKFVFDNTILTLSTGCAHIYKALDNVIESAQVNEDLSLVLRIMEKRENGVLYSIITKKYGKSNRYEGKIVLTDLEEIRYVLGNKLLSEYIGDTVGDFALSKLFLKLNENEVGFYIKSDFKSNFSSHMNTYYYNESGRSVRKNVYPTETFVNGEDVSRLFDIDGYDKISRVYNLYQGKIDTSVVNDLIDINVGLLSPSIFGYREECEITKKENELLGESKDNNDENYKNYLKYLFKDRFNYRGEFDLTRESLLSVILYKAPLSEKVKKDIELAVGMPYEEFEKLDCYDQHDLLRKKRIIKSKSDTRTYVDGIPVDNKHIVSSSHYESPIKRVLSRFRKKKL